MGAVPVIDGSGLVPVIDDTGLVTIHATPAYTALVPKEQQRFNDVARQADLPDVEWLDGKKGLTAQDLRLYIASREAAVPGNAALHLAVPAVVASPVTVGAGMTLPAFREAALVAQKSMFGYLANRSKSFRGCVYGPTLDGTYFYRLGSRGTHGWGMDKEELDEARGHLFKHGFPKLQLEELRLVNYLSYKARRTGSKGNGKDARYCVKHFPGGDERVELTEKNPVSYTDAQSIKQWLTMFSDVLLSDDPPAYVMLSHARYAREPFGKEVEPCWMLEGVPFEEIPASLNPTIVRYLREDLGFRGTIIGDWYNMGAINKFARPIAEKLDIDDDLVVAMLAIYAGVDAVPGLGIYGNQLEELAQKHPARYQEFMARVDQTLIERFHRMGGDPKLDIDLSSMRPRDKLDLICDGSTSVSEPEEDDKALLELLETREYNSGSRDIWNRTGVITLLMRQKIVENLTGKTFAVPPRKTSDEERWFDELTENVEFREVYDAIRWDHPAVLRVFSSMAGQVIGKQPNVS